MTEAGIYLFAYSPTHVKKNDNSAECSTAGYTDNPGFRERVEQQTLQRSAAEPERSPDERRQQGTRQANFEQHNPQRLVMPLQGQSEDFSRRQINRPTGERQ